MKKYENENENLKGIKRTYLIKKTLFEEEALDVFIKHLI